jgi:ParB family transcriptional regulator, chromosome partitioning protein
MRSIEKTKPNTVSVNPFRCRMWEYHERLQDYITEHTCKVEIESVQKHGQLIPVIGRPVRGDPDCDFELLYGARRLFVACHVNQPLLVEVRELSDQEGLILMDIENRHRKDVSPYERGRSYARWLRAGLFRSQTEMAQALRVSNSQISRLLQVAQLPNAIVNAFNSPLEIREVWGVALMKVLEDPMQREVALDRARALNHGAPLSAGETYRRLLTAPGGAYRSAAKTLDEVVKDEHGSALFRIRQLTNEVAVLLPLEKLSADAMDKIRGALADILSVQVIRTPSAASNTEVNGRYQRLRNGRQLRTIGDVA